MTRENILLALEKYFLECKDNYISEENAILPEDVGQHMFDAPIIAIGRADDPKWEELKQPKAIGSLFKTPEEWLPDAKTVISYFAPFSEFVRISNEADPVRIGNGWLYGRVDGQAFLNGANHFLEQFMQNEGFEALSPYSSHEFKYVFSAGSNPKIEKNLAYTSNWSERHVAFVCGLGTFGLSKGLITRKGVSGRFGSIITTADLDCDIRPYEGLYDYCTMCGQCAKNCPGDAISLKEGKSHPECEACVNQTRKIHAPRFGCGKCQVNTPCEREIPNPIFR